MDVHTVCKSHSIFLFYVHTDPTVIIIDKKEVYVIMKIGCIVHITLIIELAESSKAKRVLV
jgi:hypothetical protein